VYEANLPDAFRRPQTDTALENYIRAKYEHKKYIAKEFIPTPIGKVDWTSEIDELIASKGRKKTTTTTPLMFPKLTIPPGNNKPVENLQEKLPTVEKPPPSNNLFDLSDILIDTNAENSTLPPPPPSQLLQELTLSAPEQQKMTRENILSLYGSQQQNPLFPPPGGQNPFSQMPQQQPQQPNPTSQQPFNYFNWRVTRFFLVVFL